MRLVFTCCHPALALEAQVALTLKTLCGLTVEEIARAFLVAPATMAQRLVRAKAKIRAARIPYEVPGERPSGGAAGRRPARRVPGLQRGLRRHVGRRPRAPRAVRRGHPPGPAAARPAPGVRRGGRAARPHAAPRLAAGRPSRRAGRRGHAGGAGPRAVGPGADRGGTGPGRGGACGAAAAGSTRCRRPSPRSTPRPRGRRTRTGRRSRRSTRCCCGSTPRRWWP